MSNNLISECKIAELKRLHAAATKGKLRAVGHRLSHEANRQIEQTVFHLDEIGQIGTGPYQAIPFARREDAEWHAALHNAFPGMVLMIEELQEAIRAHESTIATLKAQAQARRYARDAQQRREGAAEWLEKYAAISQFVLPINKQECLQLAKQLREGGE